MKSTFNTHDIMHSPVEKTLACGETGLGALADEAAILAAITGALPRAR